MMKLSSREIKLIAFFLILVGFGLRIHQLGADSFWNDEAGQALAATQPTMKEMFGLLRKHAMAMPFDYIVTRVSGLIGVEEFIMRFPAAVWGTLSLAVYFVFVKRLTQSTVALLTLLLLTLSARHAYYSQEMRFYAALGFFYVLSNVLMFNSIKRPLAVRWTAFVLTTAVGAYFHPYVLLSAVNGFVYLAILRGKLPNTRKVVIALMICSGILGILFLPGYLYFGAADNFQYELFRNNGSFMKIVAQAFGWRSYWELGQPSVFLVTLLVSLAVIGAIFVVKHPRRYTMLIGVTLGTGVQISLILLADAVKQYWFSPRQIVHLAPIPMIFTAIGIIKLSDVVDRFAFNNKLQMRLGLFFVMAFIGFNLFFSAPRLAGMYAYSKGNAEQIVAYLLQEHHLDEEVLVIPGHEKKIYQYYLISGFSADEIFKYFRSTTWETLPQDVTETSENIFLIAPANLSEKEWAQLNALQFQVLLAPASIHRDQSRMLLVRLESGRR